MDISQHLFEIFPRRRTIGYQPDKEINLDKLSPAEIEQAAHAAFSLLIGEGLVRCNEPEIGCDYSQVMLSVKGYNVLRTNFRSTNKTVAENFREIMKTKLDRRVESAFNTFMDMLEAH